jgi:hypothetical protein
VARFDPRSIRINELRDIVEDVQAYGIKPDPAVVHGLNVHDVIHERTTTAPTARILDLSEDEAVEHTIRLARTFADSIQGNGMSAAAFASLRVQDQITSELLEVLAADAPRMIKALRPTFDAAADQLTRAIHAGITPRSDAQDVLDLEDAEAAAIWNELDGPIRTLERIKTLRAKMSTTLGIAPQDKYGLEPYVDYTVCFTHPDTGITSGAILVYPNNVSGRRVFRTPFEEWMTLATWTNGKMQLN